MNLIWTAWNNGENHKSGAGYGIKVPISDRDAHFARRWKTVILEFATSNGFAEVKVNVGKASFWSNSCRELINKKIGEWLLTEGVAPWPKGVPPKINAMVLGERRFRVTLSTR